MKKFLLIFSFATVFLLSTLSSRAQNCSDILRIHVVNKLKFKNNKEYKKIMNEMVKMSYDELKTYRDSHAADVDFLSATITSLFSFGASFEQEKEEYERLQSKYEKNSKLDISTIDEVSLITQASDKNVIDAWQKCMDQTGVSASISGEECTSRNFILTIGYHPKNAPRKQITVQKVVHTNDIAPKDAKTISKPFIITQASDISIQFDKVKEYPGSITVDFKGYGTITVNTQNCIPPVVKPKPQYAEVDVLTDAAGNLLSQTFPAQTSPNRHNLESRIGYGELEISNKANNPTVYRVEMSRFGEGCPWSYNPLGGYDPKWVLITPTKFRWERRWAGKPCTESYIAYYKFKKTVCVANCP